MTTPQELRQRLNDLATPTPHDPFADEVEAPPPAETDRQRAARAAMLAREAIDALEEMQRQPIVLDPNLGVSVAVDFSKVFDFGFIEGGPEDDFEPIGKRRLADAILEAAARLLIADLDVSKGIKRGEGPTHEIRKLADSMLRTEIQEQIKPLVTEAIATPRYKTDQWGTKVSGAQPVTLAEIIRDEATKYITTKTSARSSEPQLTPLERLIKTTVAAEFDKQVGAAITEAQAQAVAAVKDRASKFLAQNVVGLAIEQGTKAHE